jgi:hypothetical protein
MKEIKRFTGVLFKMKVDGDSVIVSGMGMGYVNIQRSVQ